jgi:DNA-directed RNA polymerase specialized sigma subunit
LRLESTFWSIFSGEKISAKGEKGIDKNIAKVYNYFVVAKYDSLRKIERNQMLIEYANSHPELSLKEIGRIFNISESRVCRILKGNNKKERAACGSSPQREGE